MVGHTFSFFTSSQIEMLRDKVLELLQTQGVKLDPHPQMFKALADAGANVDTGGGMVRFPKPVMERLLKQAPKKFSLGARQPDAILELPRPDGTFYARTNTGGHGWIEPDTQNYRKVTSADLTAWARLVTELSEISFIAFLFCNDVPVQTADVHGLSTLLKNTPKHAWVQPYSTGSVEYLIRLGEAAAGGKSALAKNPVISMIACSLAPKAFKQMDLEIIYQSAKASLPIQACSLPGAGGTAPATTAGVILLASAEILAMLAMAQAVAAGTPVVACPIIFSTDMLTGRSLQSSVEAFKAASGAVQFIKAAFDLPTHNYGSGSDSPIPDGQGMSERAMLSMLMGLSGSDILGGAGQLEVATVLSPLQLIIDNEVIGMIRQLMRGIEITDDSLAWDVLAGTKPGEHFLTSKHTLRHCRDVHRPGVFARPTREGWERQGKKDVMDRALEHYRKLMDKENPYHCDTGLLREIDSIVGAADKQLIG